MKNRIFYCLLPLLLILGACKSTKSPTEKVDKMTNTKSEATTVEKPHTKLIEMEKGACHGTCPIYTFTIYNDGSTEFMGKRFCKYLGPNTSSISDLELKLVKQKMELLNMENYPEKIHSMIPDFPSTTITSFQDGTMKSVWWRDGAPDELNEMAITLDKLREGLDWKINTKAPLPPGTIKNQLLVQLEEGVVASDFCKQYNEFDLVPNKELMPGQGYWLFDFDSDKISGYEMINLLNNSDKVRNVEFNKVVEQRN